MSNHVPNGKIARLPGPLRLELNLMLQDHTPAPRIIRWLEEEHAAELKAAGIEKLKPLNVSRWRCNGYQKWLRREERLEEMRAQQEFALELAAQNDNSLQRASVAMAASQI